MAATKRIGIYGTGGHGKVVAQVARACGYAEVVWIDDNAADGAVTFDAFVKAYPDTPVALGVGNNAARCNVFERLREAELIPSVLIHPTASIAPDAVVGEGTVVMPLAVINAETLIGRGVIVNSGAVIEHECRLGDFVHVSPNGALAGGVRVGEQTHIGIGSCVVQGISIGRECIVAAGAAVIAPLPDRVMAAGVPAVIKKEWS